MEQGEQGCCPQANKEEYLSALGKELALLTRSETQAYLANQYDLHLMDYLSYSIPSPQEHGRLFDDTPNLTYLNLLISEPLRTKNPSLETRFQDIVPAHRFKSTDQTTQEALSLVKNHVRRLEAVETASSLFGCFHDCCALYGAGYQSNTEAIFYHMRNWEDSVKNSIPENRLENIWHITKLSLLQSIALTGYVITYPVRKSHDSHLKKSLSTLGWPFAMAWQILQISLLLTALLLNSAALLIQKSISMIIQKPSLICFIAACAIIGCVFISHIAPSALPELFSDNLFITGLLILSGLLCLLSIGLEHNKTKSIPAVEHPSDPVSSKVLSHVLPTSIHTKGSIHQEAAATEETAASMGL